MKLGEKFRLTLIAIPFTMFAVIVCVFVMGGGHGTYAPTIYLFPYAMLAALSDHTIGTTSIVLGFIQYLFYGLIIDLTKGTKSGGLIGIGFLLAHILTAMYVMSNKGESF